MSASMNTAICDACETVAHCSKSGCVPVVELPPNAIALERHAANRQAIRDAATIADLRLRLNQITEQHRMCARILADALDKLARQVGSQRDAVLDQLDALGDDAIAHIWPNDLARCQSSECTVQVASVRMGSPEGNTVPLFSRNQVAAALASAFAQATPQPNGGAA